ncbi:hypothetical protein [Clostridium sp.]|uniref:hypothetical protein n=1 Tax=Clostridium sp. TaxID=1506 RepID=UPI00321786C6
MAEEGLINTKHEKIFIGKPTSVDFGDIKEMIRELEEVIDEDNPQLLINKIQEIVPTYNRTMKESAVTAVVE